MSDESEPKGTVAPSDQPKAEPTPERVKADDLPPEALKARLDSSRQAGAREAEQALMQKLGMSADEAAEAIARLKKIEDESKTEQQRLQEERDALRPKAERADTLSKRIERLSEAQYSGLSDDDKVLVDELANGSDGSVDHDRRIDVIAALQKTGRIGGAKAPAVIPKGSSTSNADPPPKTQPEPEKDSPEFHYAKWKGLSSQLLKNAYWNDHAAQISKAESFKAGAS